MSITSEQIQIRDHALVQIVDAAVAESVHRGGAWVVCRPGCTPCCHGPFAITGLDALRLRSGLSTLAVTDAARALRVGERARQYAETISPLFPGNPTTGALADEDGLPGGDWDDAPCPALDPASGLCDLYESRPLTCRVFGPAMRADENGAVGACELCYEGATDEQIAECSVEADPSGLEETLVAELNLPPTIVAFALFA